MRLAAAALAAALAAAPAAALEPRFDHRDEQGVLVEAGASRDTVSAGGGPSESANRAFVRVGYGFDVSGEGGELVLSGSLRLGADGTPESLRWAADLRYRGYFGTEELKTFFEVGLWVPVSTRLAIGPRVGIGVAYDFGRTFGLYSAFGFGTGFGPLRLASLELAAGLHARWP